ncbi:MAG: hypothetical protein HT580_06810 [Dechloromonas sp.]|nr:MAG: hypothetical protein HT580_06810 [Dechloromonas sp.]
MIIAARASLTVSIRTHEFVAGGVLHVLRLCWRRPLSIFERKHALIVALFALATLAWSGAKHDADALSSAASLVQTMIGDAIFPPGAGTALASAFSSTQPCRCGWPITRAPFIAAERDLSVGLRFPGSTAKRAHLLSAPSALDQPRPARCFRR